MLFNVVYNNRQFDLKILIIWSFLGYFNFGTSVACLLSTSKEAAMKKTVFILLVILISANTSIAYNNYGNGFAQFYSSLQPHGEWIELDYDLYAWQPNNVGYSWRPYSDGRWEWTRNGWYWVSYEPFGWATYHYGRWFYDDYYGWLWLPDTEWGPSWVEWRYNDNYIGWAPLPPYASFNNYSGIHFSFNWNSGYYHWNFVNYHNFRHHKINVHIVNNYRCYNIFNNTKYRTNYYDRDGRIVNGGVDRNFVERQGGYKIRERKIEITSDVQTYRTESQNNSRDRIVSYKPRLTDNDKNQSIEKKNIRRGEVNSSLKKDRIVLERSEVEKRSAEIVDKNNPKRSVESNKSTSKSEPEIGTTKRTNNSGEKSKEKLLEVKSISKPVQKSENENVTIRKNTESKPELKTTKNITKTKSGEVKADRTVKRKVDSDKQKRTLKHTENSTKEKRLLQ
jgi:hypothetical protein